MTQPVKPLGRKAYGSIPHLPGSRLGPGDRHCEPGQAAIACLRTRDQHDRVIAMEKLDGACVSVAKHEGDILAVIRAGYLAKDSPYQHLQKFGVWVEENKGLFDRVLAEGERFVGEWLAMAHGTLYDAGPPLILFDLMREGRRLPHDFMMKKANIAGLPTAYVLSDGPPISIEAALDMLGERGFHGAQEAPEGVVWKVERNHAFDFNCKYVRHDKQDGKYIPGIGAEEPIWMR